MPSGYAHYRFGTGLLPQFPGDVKRTVQRFRTMFDLGLHGPDIFYYSSPLIKANAGFLGIKFHEQTGQEFFVRVCRMLRMEKSEAGNAYLYGLLCHYCLDSVCHPYILEAAARGDATHIEIETDFDRFLLEADSKTPARIRELSTHMKPTQGECETIAKFYPPAGARYVKDAVRGMAFFTRQLAAPTGIKKAAVSAGLWLGSKELQGMVMTGKPNPACEGLNPGLMEQYQRAAAQLPAMLPQLLAHMTYSAPFGAEFAVSFAPAEIKETAEVTT